MRLSNDDLDHMPKDVAVPAYDRASLGAGIVHVGVGNFHRAHQAVYLDELFSRGLDHDWAITGAGVRPPDARMQKLLEEQDNLSTVIELDPAGPTARIIGSMTGFLPVEEDNAALTAAMTLPETRIVSLTVTEGGYYVDASGAFDAEHPEIRADAANPRSPKTVFGAICAALAARRSAGLGPFTVMSCDNLPGNGAVTRSTVTGLAQLTDPDLARWIADTVAFPNSMVDRITPATGDAERALARDRFGLDDPVPVTCEPFRQWVLEDNFTAGRPRLEEVGVTLTDQVHIYETMKIRILNGGHAIIAYPAALLDIEFAHDAMADPLVAAFLRKVEETEILPHVTPVPEMSPADYLTLIEGRFANPAVRDTTRRLCLDGSNRQPKFIVPSIRDGLLAGRSTPGLALETALWCRYCAGTTDSGRSIAPNDPNWDVLTKAAASARETPAAWLGMEDIYGDIGRNPVFAEAFARWLAMLWQDGTSRTLQTYLSS